MIVPLNSLIESLEGTAAPNDTKPSEALWIRFGQEKTHKTVEYKTGDSNTIVHVYLDDQGALVGIEIFP